MQQKKPQQKTEWVSKKWKVDLTSGLLGGFVSVTCCAPLDIMRTRLNMQYGTKSKGKYNGFLDAVATIKREEGLKGFYKGYKATAITYPLFYSLFFGIYNNIKPYVKEKLNSNNQYLQYIVASCTSGLICDVITNPLWLVRTRMQTQYLHDQSCNKYNGVLTTLKLIYQEEGFKALFKGLGASLLGLSHVAIYFPIYEYLKIELQKKKPENQELNSYDILFASVTTKIVSCIATYPHIVIRTRLFDNRSNYKGEGRTRLTQIIQRIYSERGIRGFYSGLKIDLIRVLPANTITFLVYEASKQYLEKTL